jgi:uncharacterized membrane-anchored protein
MVNKKYVVIIIIVWGLFLLVFMGYKQFIFYTGTDVTLKTVPVDPRDLFRGEYVILNYTINSINLDSILTIEKSFKKNDEIYLKLEMNSKYAKAIEVSKNRFKSGIGIKGVVSSWNENRLDVKYGIETYFVRQGKGKEIESKIEKIDVVVTIDKYGKALIKKLQFEDENIDME